MSTLIFTTNNKNRISLLQDGSPVPVLTNNSEWPGVLRAAGDLCLDFERVCGTAAEQLTESFSGTFCIIAGSLEKNPLVQNIASDGKLDKAYLESRPESFIIRTIDNPVPGIDRALVIAGADKRGTIFGIYEISAQLGVSPWYWWADVPPRKSEQLWLDPEACMSQAPGVRYRGIFLNDEAPALTNWVKARYGEARVRNDEPVPPGIANYGREFYCRIFELLLRLKANYLWPAMWNNAFNEDDPENPRLADEYGIVMGTSHQEPMLRSQKEWDRRYKKSLGYWNYIKHAEILEKFWKEGLERNKAYESIISIGLRGADDTPMTEGGPEENKALLEKIVQKQRSIISEVTGKAASEVPQLWCLYKETQEYYEKGMRVPDDVTLLWSDDNWGNLRRVPSSEERQRSGGAGIYYHFDYHGDPRSYQWINTSQIAKIWDQMSLARQYGADRVWIVNVGHFKGYEYPTSFFLDMAWNPEAFGPENIAEYTVRWTESLFGSEAAEESAEILEALASCNARRKPELLSANTWSQVHYGESERVVQQWTTLQERAENLVSRIPEAALSAYQQLILFPVQSSTLLALIYDAAGKNKLWAQQGRACADKEAERVQRLFTEFKNLIQWYNKELSGGKWDHFMDQAVLGYTYWADPPRNNLDHLNLKKTLPVSGSRMGIAIEGSENNWPEHELDAIPCLPPLDSIRGGTRYIDIFRRGNDPVDFNAVPSEPWLLVDRHSGRIDDQQRIYLSVDWDRMPEGRHTACLGIDGGNEWIRVFIECFKPAAAEQAQLRGFIESDGCIVIHAMHFQLNKASGTNVWLPLSNYGQYGGMRSCGETASDSGRAILEYEFSLFDDADVEIIFELSSVLNYMNNQDICLGFRIDEAAEHILTVVPAAYLLTPPNPDWARSVIENKRRVRQRYSSLKRGVHRIQVLMISPGLVLERILIHRDSLRSESLGPEESVFIQG